MEAQVQIESEAAGGTRGQLSWPAAHDTVRGEPVPPEAEGMPARLDVQDEVITFHSAPRPDHPLL